MPLTNQFGDLALDAHLTDGTQKAIARGGAKGATTAADVTSTAEGADHQALDVQLYHGGAAVKPLSSSDVKAYSDIFSSLVTGTRANQVEVHFDDTAWASYLTPTLSGGGSAAQTNGYVQFSTSSGTTSQSKYVTVDYNRYRPHSEDYGAFTGAWVSGGIASSYQHVGIGDATNGVFFGYGDNTFANGSAFGVIWRRGGTDAFVPRSSWLDQCNGSAGSKFTRNGVPENMNPANFNIFRIRMGLFGVAGAVCEVFSPDGDWVQVYFFQGTNNSQAGFFTNLDLPMMVDLRKNSAGGTDLQFRSICWAAGTTSQYRRLTDTISDNNLAILNQSVIVGKKTSGGGGYVAVKVNPSGAAAVDATGSIVTVNQGAAGTAKWPIADSTDTEWTPVATTVSNSGDNFIYTPAAGKRIRLHWIYAINDPTATTPVKITIMMGANTYYVAWAISKRQQFTGPINGSLNINLSVGGNVAVTAFIEEI